MFLQTGPSNDCHGSQMFIHFNLLFVTIKLIKVNSAEFWPLRGVHMFIIYTLLKCSFPRILVFRYVT